MGSFWVFMYKRAVGQKKWSHNGAGENVLSGTIVKGRYGKNGLFTPIHPSLGDRACHNSAEQTRASCQHLICWRLGNYSIPTIPCHSRSTFELWGDVKFRSCLRFHAVWKARLYQGENCTDDLRGVMLTVYLGTMHWLSFSCFELWDN